jgi:uncharacterized protein YqjF (DUF2071 family)
VEPRDPARFESTALARPRTRWRDVTTTLADFAIITFAVEPERLAAILPPELEPEVVTLDSGRTCALVSAVPFRDLDFRFGFAPWLRFKFGQTNYRAYVRYRGTRCVWFFGTTLDTRWVAIPRYRWKLPWHRARMTFDSAWTGTRCDRYNLTATGAWGDADVALTGTDEPVGRLDGFVDTDDTRVVLTHPLAGYFRRRDNAIGSYSVWHAPIDLRIGSATRARFAVFEELGLVAPDAVPHSVLVAPTTEFIVLLPPRRVT